MICAGLFKLILVWNLSLFYKPWKIFVFRNVIQTDAKSQKLQPLQSQDVYEHVTEIQFFRSKHKNLQGILDIYLSIYITKYKIEWFFILMTSVMLLMARTYCVICSFILLFTHNSFLKTIYWTFHLPLIKWSYILLIPIVIND